MNLPAVAAADAIQSGDGSEFSSVKCYEHVFFSKATGQGYLGDSINDHRSGLG